MPTMDDFFTSDYIKAGDLQGREVPVIIAKVKPVALNDEKKCALFFEGKKKALLLNKTNANRIATAYGKDMDGWIGKEIFLYPDETQFNGQVVPCLRVRVPLAKAEPGDDRPLPF